MKYRIPFRERILCSPAEAGEALDMGKTRIFEMIAQGRGAEIAEGWQQADMCLWPPFLGSRRGSAWFAGVWPRTVLGRM